MTLVDIDKFVQILNGAVNCIFSMILSHVSHQIVMILSCFVSMVMVGILCWYVHVPHWVQGPYYVWYLRSTEVKTKNLKTTNFDFSPVLLKVKTTLSDPLQDLSQRLGEAIVWKPCIHNISQFGTDHMYVICRCTTLVAWILV